jgi:hypothetical protein
MEAGKVPAFVLKNRKLVWFFSSSVGAEECQEVGCNLQ